MIGKITTIPQRARRRNSTMGRVAVAAAP